MEGAEYPILKTIPLDKVDIKVINFEYNKAGQIFKGTPADMSRYLVQNGYKFHAKIQNQDAVFVKDGYLPKNQP